jgi:hypothetical protein
MERSAISPESRDRFFRIALKNLEFASTHGAQKGSPAKGTGHTLRVALQYSHKSPKNNVLFPIWLADFGGKPHLLQRLLASSVG